MSRLRSLPLPSLIFHEPLYRVEISKPTTPEGSHHFVMGASIIGADFYGVAGFNLTFSRHWNPTDRTIRTKEAARAVGGFLPQRWIRMARPSPLGSACQPVIFPQCFQTLAGSIIDSELSLDLPIEVSHRLYRTCLLEARLHSRHNCTEFKQSRRTRGNHDLPWWHFLGPVDRKCDL